MVVDSKLSVAAYFPKGSLMFMSRFARFPNNIRKLHRPGSGGGGGGGGDSNPGGRGGRGGEGMAGIHPFYRGVGATYAELERFHSLKLSTLTA